VRSIGVQAPRTAAAFARGRAEFDQAKRIAIYREMQLAALEETPLVGLTWRAQGYAMDRSVQGFTNLPGELTTSSGGMIEETYFG
jgi:peptide/nickel transport system substrate-binding protein